MKAILKMPESEFGFHLLGDLVLDFDREGNLDNVFVEGSEEFGCVLLEFYKLSRSQNKIFKDYYSSLIQGMYQIVDEEIADYEIDYEV